MVQFLDPETAKILQFLDPEIVNMDQKISGSRNSRNGAISGSRNCRKGRQSLYQHILQYKHTNHTEHICVNVTFPPHPIHQIFNYLTNCEVNTKYYRAQYSAFLAQQIIFCQNPHTTQQSTFVKVRTFFMICLY